MESALFVNISDIHVNYKNKDRVNNKLDELIKYLNVLSIEHKNIFLLVSGDIAYSGKREEYEYVYERFEKLAIKYNLILCPGNHDHDFSVYQSIVRNQLLKADVDDLDGDSIELIIEGMSDYFVFEKSLKTFESYSENKLSKLYVFNIGERKVSITTLNSAWCSQRTEQGGSMLFPMKFFIEPPKCDIKITMLHHPLSWFEPDNHKKLRNILRENSNIVITGHEHIADSLRIESTSNKCLMLEAMSFDDDWSQDNGFITFNFESNDVFIKKIKWKDGKFSDLDNIKQSEIIKNNAIGTNNFFVNN
ncbi:metallophosphoesterase family protein, partial [Rosenbergiella australiborealis]|uniref:metallophosphoesterase family protein n=1 Tax=Rosenbergiella australiborealis TaxID=1544696 RepID=UPI001F4E2DEA